VLQPTNISYIESTVSVEHNPACVIRISLVSAISRAHPTHRPGMGYDPRMAYPGIGMTPYGPYAMATSPVSLIPALVPVPPPPPPPADPDDLDLEGSAPLPKAVDAKPYTGDLLAVCFGPCRFSANTICTPNASLTV
jgi:hypothetical protein